MNGATFRRFLTVAVVVGYAQGGPLPEGNNLVVTTDSPDAANILDQMMGDTPSNINGIRPPVIYSLNVNSEIQFRFAKTLVTTKVINPAEVSQQLSYAVVLPQDAFITGFVMETSEKSYAAFLSEKSEAEKAYTRSVKSEKSGALVSFRESNLFNISVNIEANKKITFKLAYEELLKREFGYYRHVVTVSPGQIVPRMKVKVHIIETRNITKITTPKFAMSNLGVKSCSGANMNSTCVSDDEMVTKTKYSDSEVLLEFGLSNTEQKRLVYGSGKGLSGQFEVLYDVARDSPGGEILVKDGYFVHYLAPAPKTASLPKHIIFVLDISGSMDGDKIAQLKDAMATILPTLLPDDLFNVIVFSDYIKTWGVGGVSDLLTEENGKPTSYYDSIQRAFAASPSNIEAAVNSVQQMVAVGGTNIFGALRQGVRTAKRQQSNQDPNRRKHIIFFLTDGEPNEGITKPDEIISELAKINTGPQIPIYSFSFGEGASFDFLKNLSLANSGVARRIYEGLAANVQLERVYDTISTAVLSNVTFKYVPEEVDLSSVSKVNYHTFFEGGEIVVSGRTIDKAAKQIIAEVTASGKGFTDKKIKVQSVVAPTPIYRLNASAISLADPNATHQPGSMERTWAYLTIKQLIEKSKTTPASSTEPDPLKRAITLAKKYSFATEVTSFVVVKPDGQKQIAEAQHIIPDKELTPPTFTADQRPPVDEPDEYANLPAVDKKSRAYNLYTNLDSLQDVSWLSSKNRKDGYVDLLSLNGTFTRYFILSDLEPLDPEDGPGCNIDNFTGKCRHFSHCIVREIANDYQKFRQFYQCQLDVYLAICCPR